FHPSLISVCGPCPRRRQTMSSSKPVEAPVETSDRILDATHKVENQTLPLAGYNAYEQDPALREALHREGGSRGEERLQSFGVIAGHELVDVGFSANENPPEFKPFDAYGHRIDQVEFHPAYHRSMEIAKAHDLHGLSWRGEREGEQVVRSALTYI